MESSNNLKASSTPSLKSRVIIALLIGGLSIALVNIISAEAHLLGLGRLPNNILSAIILSGLVVTGVWLLRRRDGFIPKDIGFERKEKAPRKFLLGVCLILIPLTITILVAFVTGWGGLELNSSSPILKSLAFGLVLTFLTDALPEEVLFRGYIYSNLNLEYNKIKSSIITIVFFALTPVFSMLIQKQLLGYEVSIGGANTITPSYLITLVIFGAFILYLRILTRSVWTSIGFHLIFVFMNQLMGPGPDRLIQFTDQNGEQALQLTLMALLIIVFIGLLIYPRIMKKPIGWKEKLVLKANSKLC